MARGQAQPTSSEESSEQRNRRAETTWRILKIAVLYVPLAAFISLIFVPWFRENVAP